jgi:hypothetical protein
VSTYRPSWWFTPESNHRLQNVATIIYVSFSLAIRLFIFSLSIYLHTYLSIYLETELQTAKELRAMATEIAAPKPNLTKATNNRF